MTKPTDYERIAADYDANADRLQIPVDTVLESVLAQGGRRMLDLACGTGNYSRVQQTALGQMAVQWHGLDASPAMLGVAAGKVQSHLVNGRSETLPYASETFAYIACNFAFHHFPDKTGALKEISRVLIPGGRLRLQNLCPEKMTDWWVYRYFPETIALDEPRFWSLAQIETGLGACGLTVEMQVEMTETAVSLEKLLADARRRDISQLALLAEPAYLAGLARLDAAYQADPQTTVIDYFAMLWCYADKRGDDAGSGG